MGLVNGINNTDLSGVGFNSGRDGISLNIVDLSGHSSKVENQLPLPRKFSKEWLKCRFVLG